MWLHLLQIHIVSLKVHLQGYDQICHSPTSGRWMTVLRTLPRVSPVFLEEMEQQGILLWHGGRYSQYFKDPFQDEIIRNIGWNWQQNYSADVFLSERLETNDIAIHTKTATCWWKPLHFSLRLLCWKHIQEKGYHPLLASRELRI